MSNIVLHRIEMVGNYCGLVGNLICMPTYMKN